jgi:hypothetical protein
MGPKPPRIIGVARLPRPKLKVIWELQPPISGRAERRGHHSDETDSSAGCIMTWAIKWRC